jgi:hypothetical protein
MRARVAHIEAQQRKIEHDLVALRAEDVAHAPDRGLVAQRSSDLAERMNQFVAQLPPSAALGAPVTVNSNTLEVFVGRDVWNQVLGNERMVVFLLAYHYALLRLGTEVDTPFPGLAILDNPFQQDLRDDLTIAGITQIAQLCEGREDIQAVITTRRRLGQIPAHRIRFSDTFEPSLDDLDD